MRNGKLVLIALLGILLPGFLMINLGHAQEQAQSSIFADQNAKKDKYRRKAAMKIERSTRGFRNMALYGELQFGDLTDKKKFVGIIVKLRKCADKLRGFGNGPEFSNDQAISQVDHLMTALRVLLFQGKLEFSNDGSINDWRKNMVHLDRAMDFLRK